MTTYWLSDSCALLKSLNVIPFGNEDINEDYNSLTRLIILVTFAMAFLRPDDYSNILISGIISVCLTVIFYFMNLNVMNRDEKTNIEPKSKKESKNKLKIGDVSGNQFIESIQRYNNDNQTAYKKEGLSSAINFTELFKIKK